MQLLETLAELENWRSAVRQAGKTIGFAPTMGALHHGHLSLINQSQKRDDVTLCSIFVNPTQFNDPSDLQKYPRNLQQDIQMLQEAGTDAVFIPSEAEIYPETATEMPSFQLEHLTKLLEGKHRPGHFEGVVQVVHRLLDLVQPDHLYMGLKDFQQQRIIAEMLRQMKSDVKLIPCPIVREEDGLAMSSRNGRIAPELRQKANIVYQTLKMAKHQWKNANPPTEIRKYAIKKLEKAGLKVDYFEITDVKTLESLTTFDKSTTAIASVAAWLGDVRLIDNMRLRRRK